LFENALTIQFDHRMLAYLIWLLAMLHAFGAWRARRAAAGALTLAGAVTLQAALGIVTLLEQSALPLALAHQMGAMLAFTVAVLHAERLWHRAGLPAPQTLAEAAT
jgi:cytochrome c oxidase assembly protein subunit 15